MDWDKLDVHIENLAPGLATAWALSQVWAIPGTGTTAGEVAVGITLLGAAYLLGVYANVLGRLLFDPTSEYISRAWVLRVFCQSKLQNMRGATRAVLNKAYNRYCAEGLRQTHTAKEIAKRRQTGRLVRSSLIPLAVFTLYRGRGLPTIELAGVLVLEYCVLLFLYGYSEATILHEAYHAVPEAERRILESDEKPVQLHRSAAA